MHTAATAASDLPVIIVMSPDERVRCRTVIVEEVVDFSTPIFLFDVCCSQSRCKGPIRAFDFSICLRPVRCNFSVPDVVLLQVFLEGVGDKLRAIVAGYFLR